MTMPNVKIPFFWRMRVWRDSLRMQRRAGHDVQMPLSQLPTNDWQRIFSRSVASGRGFQVTRGQMRYHFTSSAAGGQHKRGFCAECGSLLTGGENTDRPTSIIGVTAGTLMTRAGFSRRWTFSFQTRNRGTK
jgi:Glutathione-dependent formaldehyde-activating enzyme